MKFTYCTVIISAIVTLVLANLALATDSPQKEFDLKLKADGTISVPRFELPFSSLASDQARAATVERMRGKLPTFRDIANVRSMMEEQSAPVVKRAALLYPYDSGKSKIDSVPIETFVPADGVAEENSHRVLIQLHGGGFVAGGGGIGGALESTPIVGVGRYKVVAVDYRLGPEHRFPAASEDVATVYRELLKTYRPENIGIYGCSAGGMLAAQTIPWLLQEDLPLPGALGIFCASAHNAEAGDSAQLWTRLGSVLSNVPQSSPGDKIPDHAPYLGGKSTSNPLVIPGASREILSQFPPTLFLTGTRAPEMSAASFSHLELKLLGRESELILFDGMDHAFFMDPDIPESKQAYKLIAGFFDKYLGKEPGPN